MKYVICICFVVGSLCLLNRGKIPDGDGSSNDRNDVVAN